MPWVQGLGPRVCLGNFKATSPDLTLNGGLYREEYFKWPWTGNLNSSKLPRGA